ncbi:hypothetical protein XM38_026130 [Halomicronema hongdechloris C2206]|uniref:Regulator of SigK n=1 Tax=Halomicronema hongdechloris C2206 TaxID=1641165 RepID=A0A1Z3HMY2_9CYAN|nr:anti-sigma factor [Halomicronema hongdechloris]ASC71659.1 hypothetical protein XM38_026130 [Halomicronema hongdechloris C2206]
MTSSALPDNWQDLLAGYVLGDLDAEETARVQHWLNQYPEVTAELTALQETWHSLPQGLPAQAPPATLRQRIMAEIQPTATAPRQERRRPWAVVGFSGWALTAVALVSVVVENYQLRQDNQQQQAILASISQPENQLYLLAGTDNAPDATGRLIIDPSQQSALIATQNLPSLPTDQAYRLWTLAGDTDNPIYCGQFNPSGEAAWSQWSLPDPACQTTPGQFLITQESTQAPPNPQGPLVLQGQS